MKKRLVLTSILSATLSGCLGESGGGVNFSESSSGFSTQKVTQNGVIKSQNVESYTASTYELLPKYPSSGRSFSRASPASELNNGDWLCL